MKKNRISFYLIIDDIIPEIELKELNTNNKNKFDDYFNYLRKRILEGISDKQFKAEYMQNFMPYESKERQKYCGCIQVSYLDETTHEKWKTVSYCTEHYNENQMYFQNINKEIKGGNI